MCISIDLGIAWHNSIGNLSTSSNIYSGTHTYAHHCNEHVLSIELHSYACIYIYVYICAILHIRRFEFHFVCNSDSSTYITDNSSLDASGILFDIGDIEAQIESQV